MSAPSKSQAMSHSASGYHDSSRASGAPGRSHTISLPQSLRSSIDAISNRSASTGSPTSSGGSHSLVDKSNSGGAPATPSRRQQGICDVSSFQQRAQHGFSAERGCQASSSGSALQHSLTSPTHGRLQTHHDFSSGSPQKLVTRRLSQVQALSGLQGTQTRQRGDSNATQPAQPSPRLSGRGSFGSSLRSTTFQHSSHDLNANYMTGVPEPLAVQEVAFRQGQHDFSSSRDIVPSSPFAQQFDAIWAESYKLGKAFGAAPIEHRGTPVLPHENYIWPVFINPYTESRENPNGSVDLKWTRNICQIALNCMEALINLVCERRSEWHKIICDVPAPVQQALHMFPDLFERYEGLKRDAREALGGGLPQRY